MKVKKILLVLVSTCIMSGIALAQNGFEFGISIPVGASAGFASQSYKDGIDDDAKKYRDLKGAVGFEWGVSLQPGYRIGFGDTTSLSILLDLGYKRDTFAYNQQINWRKADGTPDGDKKTYTTYQFESIQLGLYPKFNIGKFAIGIGGGVKIHLVGYSSSQSQVEEKNADTGVWEYKDSLETEMYAFTKKQLKDTFKSGIVGYAKISGDYAFELSETTAATVGIYVGYDFPTAFKVDDKYGLDDTIYSKQAISGLDFGLQFGLKFGAM